VTINGVSLFSDYISACSYTAATAGMGRTYSSGTLRLIGRRVWASGWYVSGMREKVNLGPAVPHFRRLQSACWMRDPVDFVTRPVTI